MTRIKAKNSHSRKNKRIEVNRKLKIKNNKAKNVFSSKTTHKELRPNKKKNALNNKFNIFQKRMNKNLTDHLTHIFKCVFIRNNFTRIVKEYFIL